ncbi:hypothetical protein APR41_16025 [Salegentibacter salinarum]|uniref:Polysaccharide biosynthesis protein C-terminal domain-containing protein n=1 Tax=Salegentibacter salinarum TaxID=447422 RepID=A0A2N0TXJ8_9FLAO|nr:MOP flippase family protein [Salegentibacter salinarum]PKD19467.1 hypothetical protein APR41_16025 [Salegentibacter salinarum]SKB91960.1 polysaccharide transporter, PST family [Salegentibacter salinarum]
MTKKKKVIKGTKWTTLGAIVTSVVQLLQITILTRFLNKDDFGLMALALFIIGFSRIFVDMGLSNTIIFKQNVHKSQLSSLFWLNVFFGILIYFILIISAPFIGIFYESNELTSVIIVIATTFLVIPWGQQYEALLKKELNFKALAIRDIIGKVTGLITAVILAYLNYGVFSLVIASLTTAVISTFLVILYGIREYKPQFMFSYKSLKDQGFFSFGFYQVGEKLINYFNGNFDTILIGKLLGMEALGLYNIAKSLAIKPFQILNPVLTKVAFPFFASIKGEPVRLKNAYIKVVILLTSANAPVYILSIILSEPIISFAFGAQWIEAAPIFEILCIMILSVSVGNPVGSLQLAKGRADWGFYWNLGLFFLMPATIWLGSSFGLLGIAISLAILRTSTIIYPIWYLFLKPLCDINYTEYFQSFAIPIGISLISGIIPLFLYSFISNLFLATISTAIIYTLIYLMISRKLNLALIHEVKELNIFRKIKGV